MDPRELRNIFGRFASGVTVITCTSPAGRPHGATVTAFTSVSLDPPLCQVTLTRSSKACAYLSGAPFAVNVLAVDQTDTALHFAGRPQLATPAWADGPAAPILCGSAATLSCEPWAEYDGGDHLIFIGEVVDVAASDREPLIFYRGTFHHIGARSSAAAWKCSMDDPDSGWFDATTSFTPLHLLAGKTA
jgi:flavin reductase (DIM6/NTAB) family NADH-FMN oxidoreductase RutF